MKKQIAYSKKAAWLFSKMPGSLISKRESPLMHIEVSSLCNLSCTTCPTNRGMKGKKGLMKLDDFKNIIDLIRGYKTTITMSFRGEPTLNKDVFKMIKYAGDNGIFTVLSTNGSFLDNFDLDEIFCNVPYRLMVALDGASKESYLQHRKGGDFDKIVSNLRKICQEKEKRRDFYPIIDLQMVVFKGNQAELDKMESLAEDIGVDILEFKKPHFGWYAGFNEEYQKKIEKELKPKEEFLRHETGQINYFCPFIWQLTVLFNGDVIFCCADYNETMNIGNILEQGYKGIINSQKYKRKAKMVLRKEFLLCKDCDLMKIRTSDRIKQIKFNENSVLSPYHGAIK